MASNTSVSGCVKWFNSKHKYGFINVVSEGEHKNVDIFVHQSNITTKEPCYRYLVAGENVKFEIKITDDQKHPKQAVNVLSETDSPLKCELPKPDFKSNAPRRSFPSHRGRGGGRGRGGYGYGRSGYGYGRRGYNDENRQSTNDNFERNNTSSNN